MISCMRHSLGVKLLLPLVVLALLALIGFSQWERASEASRTRAQAAQTGSMFASALELSADLAGEVGLERAATVLGAQRGIGTLAVTAGPDRIVVASNDLTLRGVPWASLARSGEGPSPARAHVHTLPTTSIKRIDDHLDVMVPLDLGTLALYSPEYRDSYLTVDVHREYGGISGLDEESARPGLWVLLGLIGTVLLASAAVLYTTVVRRLRHLRRAVEERRNGEKRDLPVGASDEIGLLARSLDDAFTTIDESAHWFRSMIEGSSDLVVVLDAAGRITYASPSTGSLLGYPEESAVGMDAFAFVHPEDLEKVGGRFLEIVEDPDTPQIQQFEIRLIASDGNPIPVEVRGSNRFDTPGVGGLILNMRDVTERNEALAALRASEARTRAILDSAADGILMVGVDGRIESCNGAAERMFGRAEAEMVGEQISLLVPAGSERLHEASPRGVTADGGQTIYVDLEGRRAGGERFPIEATANAVSAAPTIGFTVVMRDVTERRELERRLAHQALHDELTGLPNRRAFLDRVEMAMARARRSGGLVALLFLDLDRFKVVNDSLGHDQGDNLLRQAAERMLHSIRESDTLARIGGDEFLVLCEDVDSVLSTTDLASRLCATLDEPFQLGESEVSVGGSIGIAVWDGGNSSPDDLLRRADTAMYRAKDAGRGRYVLFDDAMQTWAVERLESETALRHGVQRGEMVVHYQPVVDLATGRVEAFEALVRWERPGHGLVAPDAFIGVAEETGLIVPMGAFVLDEACRQAAEWQSRLDRTDLGIHVNLSSRQLTGPEVVDTVRAALERHDLAPGSLTLEITESFFLDDTPRVAGLLRDLEALGVRLSLDDFGTGYSSLTYLHTYPIDEIKIDCSFVRRLGSGTDDTIVAAIMQLARALGLAVVAEGIEKPEQAATLRGLGCEQGQGYLYSRPVAAAMVTALLMSGADLGGGAR